SPELLHSTVIGRLAFVDQSPCSHRERQHILIALHLLRFVRTGLKMWRPDEPDPQALRRLRYPPIAGVVPCSEKLKRAPAVTRFAASNSLSKSITYALQQCGRIVLDEKQHELRKQAAI